MVHSARLLRSHRPVAGPIFDQRPDTRSAAVCPAAAALLKTPHAIPHSISLSPRLFQIPCAVVFVAIAIFVTYGECNVSVLTKRVSATPDCATRLRVQAREMSPPARSSVRSCFLLCIPLC